MLDIRIYHGILGFLPRIMPRWTWRMMGVAMFALEMWHLRRLRPLLGMVSQRFVEYTWLLANLQSGKGRILDVGCGDSLLSHQLLRRGWEVYAVDLEPQPGAKKLLGDHFLKADATDLPFPEEFFDQIIAISTLEHMRDDVACVREVSRVLKPDGKILITVPLGFSFYDMSTVRRLIIDGLSILDEEYHIPEGGEYRKYSREEAESKVDLSSKPETIVCLVLEREPSLVKSVEVPSDGRAGFAEPKAAGAFEARILVDRFYVKSVLDIGCGPGHLVYSFRELGCAAYGLDISEHAISHAREEVRGYLVRTDANSGSLPFRNDSFDLITLTQSMEHLARIDHVISEIGRILKPGGIVFVTTPTPPFDTRLWRTLRIQRDPTHINVHSRNYWIKAFQTEAHGFKYLGSLPEIAKQAAPPNPSLFWPAGILMKLGPLGKWVWDKLGLEIRGTFLFRKPLDYD